MTISSPPLKRPQSQTTIPTIDSSKVLEKEKSAKKENGHQKNQLSNNFKTFTSLAALMEKENISREQLQIYRTILIEYLKEKEKCKSLEEFASQMGTGKHTLILAWKMLKSYESFLATKTTHQVMKAQAESMWNSVIEAVVLPQEIYQHIEMKIASDEVDNKLFELPCHYIETAIALFILPKFITAKNIPIEDYLNRKNLKKDKSAKLISPRVSSKKEKTKESTKKRGLTKIQSVTAGGKDSRLQAFSQNNKDKENKKSPKYNIRTVDRQLEGIHTYVCQIKDTLGRFDSFVDQAQSWFEKTNDEEQLKQCDKALTVTHNELEKKCIRIQDKFEKLKSLYPFTYYDSDKLTITKVYADPPSESAFGTNSSSNSPSPLPSNSASNCNSGSNSISNSNSNNVIAPKSRISEGRKTGLHRQSSLVAEKLWAELCKEEEGEFFPPLKFSERPLGHKIVNGVDITQINLVAEKQKLKKELTLYSPPHSESSLIEDADEDKENRILSDDEGSNEDNDAVHKKLEEMDDSAFDSLLEDIVITNGRGGQNGEAVTQPVQFLQNWLDKIKIQYGDILNSEIL